MSSEILPGSFHLHPRSRNSQAIMLHRKYLQQLQQALSIPFFAASVFIHLALNGQKAVRFRYAIWHLNSLAETGLFCRGSTERGLTFKGSSLYRCLEQHIGLHSGSRSGEKCLWVLLRNNERLAWMSTASDKCGIIEKTVNQKSIAV